MKDLILYHRQLRGKTALRRKRKIGCLAAHPIFSQNRWPVCRPKSHPSKNRTTDGFRRCLTPTFKPIGQNTSSKIRSRAFFAAVFIYAFLKEVFLR